MKEIDNFINTITKLEPVEFMGLARVLKEPLFTEEGEARELRDFTEVFSNVLENYSKCRRVRRREILKLVKDAAKHVKVK
jgi:hypothetical protein